MQIIRYSLWMLCAVGVMLRSTAFAAPAPKFEVNTVDGSHLSSEDLKGKTAVLEWFNSGCPFVRHFYDSHEMQGLQKKYTGKGVVWITVNSTNPEHKDFHDADATKKLISDMSAASSHFVIDSDGKLGKLFEAKTTPTMIVIDPKGEIAYRGAVDNNPDADDSTPLKKYLEPALEEVLAGKPVSLPQTEAYGCSIKYQ